MTDKKYRTADEAIKAIENRAAIIIALIPDELLESKYSELIKGNLDRSIAMIDRSCKFANFDRLVYQFGYGCSLRAVVRKAKKIDQLSPDLEKLFLESVA